MTKKILSLIFVALILFTNQVYACTEIVNKLKVKAIRGKVKVAKFDKEAVFNAVVKIRKIYENKEGEDKFEIIAETKTNEQGRFEFINIPSGTYNILVETEHFKRYWGVVKLQSSVSKKAKNKEIVIYLSLPFDCDAYAEVIKVSSS